MIASLKRVDNLATVATATKKAEAALAFDHVTVRFDDYTAVADASITIGDGEFVSIVGPTGCGKSTLLNVAAGLLEPTEGDISVDGKGLAGLNRQAGYLFQADALMPWRTALSNVITGLEYRRMAPRDAEELGRKGLGRAGANGTHQ